MSIDCGFYVLNGRMPIKCRDTLEWARWFEKHERHVADETIHGARVSTVFLGLDHQYFNGPPLLFETMVFGGLLDREMERCCTWEQAETMHKLMVMRLDILHEWDYTILLFVALQILVAGVFFNHLVRGF